MTVLRPSLPPFSSITTRMVSLAPALWPGGAAAAARVRNSGAWSPRATRPVLCRKSRRVWFITAPSSVHTTPPPNPLSASGRGLGGGVEKAALSQLKLGLRQHQVAEGADADVGSVLRGPVDRHLHLVRLLLELHQATFRLV